MPAVTIRLTGELRPGRGDGRRPSTPTVVSGWERLAAVRLRSAATAAPAVADAPSAPDAVRPRVSALEQGRVHCQVIAPALVPRRPGERIKTDRGRCRRCDGRQPVSRSRPVDRDA